MDEPTQVIYVAANLGQAHLLKNLLADEGIEAWVENEASAVHRLSVRTSDAEAARSITSIFERNARERAWAGAALFDRVHWGALLFAIACFSAYIASDRTEIIVWGALFGGAYLAFRRWGRGAARHGESPFDREASDEMADLHDVDGDADGDADNELGVEWPCCPGCNRRRLTSCPVCETAGTDFANAFLPDVGDDEQFSARVVCPICDEVFAPEYLAHCEWCGHRFADGREAPEVQVWTSPFADLNTPAWILLAGLIGLFGIATAVMLSIRAGG